MLLCCGGGVVAKCGRELDARSKVEYLMLGTLMDQLPNLGGSFYTENLKLCCRRLNCFWSVK